MSIKNRLAQLKQKKKETITNTPQPKSSVSQDFLLEANRIVACVKNKLNDIPEWFSLEDDMQVDIIKNFISEEVKDDKFLGINLDGLISKILSQVNGYGILDSIINDSQIKKIFVNSTNYISILKENEITKIPLRFDTEPELLGTVKRILSLAKIELDSDIYFYEGKLPENIIFNIIMPPISKNGISLTLEKINTEICDFEHLIQTDFLSFETAKFLENAIKNSKNILIAGTTGIGKKTLLKAMAQKIPTSERIICLEDYKTDFKSLDNITTYDYSDIINDKETISKLFKNILAQQPDKVICPNCEESIAFELLKLINNGIKGIMTTIYATSKNDALERFLGKLLTSFTGIDTEILKRRIINSFDYIVFISESKISKTVEIGEIVSLHDENFKIKEVMLEKTLQKKAVSPRKSTTKNQIKK